MPLLDVTDVLLDPDFADPTLICRRRTQVIGTDGRAVNTPSDTVFTGTPVPAKSLDLKRGDGSEYSSGAMTFITTFRLSTGDNVAGTTADIIVFEGLSYTVVDVDNWPYGGRFYQATGELLPLTP